MEVLLLIFVAASALCPASSRWYHFVYETKTQSEARSYCRQRYTDLATIQSMEDVHTLNNMVDVSRVLSPDGYNSRAWIGLYDNIHSWTWSLSDPSYYSEGQADYRNWLSGEPANQGSNQLCVFMRNTGVWQDDHCVNKYKAACVDLTGGSQTYVLTSATFSWEEAQQYCRQHYTDLASVRNAEENQQLSARVHSERAWIGLWRESWKWLDGNNATFTYWRTEGRVEPDNYSQREFCVCAYFEYAGKWEDWDCDVQKSFICYSWPVKKFTVKLQLQINSANPDDPVGTEHLLEQIKHIIREAKATELLNLSWAKDPRGRAFKKSSQKP